MINFAASFVQVTSEWPNYTSEHTCIHTAGLKIIMGQAYYIASY